MTTDDSAGTGVGSVPEPPPSMIAAADRFKEAWESKVTRSSDGAILSNREIVEMHEAALALIWATGTTSLEDALAVLDGSRA